MPSIEERLPKTWQSQRIAGSGGAIAIDCRTEVGDLLISGQVRSRLIAAQGRSRLIAGQGRSLWLTKAKRYHISDH